MSLLPYLHRVAGRESLDATDAREAMMIILRGDATDVEMAGFLVALRTKGETVEELVGFAQAMRQMAEKIIPGVQGPLLDTCGTGGDGLATFNISTVAAFVVAGAGIPVAKHGNRSLSSQCGSADLLETFGIDLALGPEQVARAIREVGIGFLFAPSIHTATKHAQPARRQLKMRTVFNLLGPLTNPAGATAQLVGAPSAESAELIARALSMLGLERGFVVHGMDGLDEISTTGPTLLFEIRDGDVSSRTLHPDDFGVRTAQLSELRGGDKQANCRIATQILEGAGGATRDIVLVNAAAALVVAGKASDFRDGMTIAEHSIDSGAALRKAEELARFSRRM
jgi:anthranilate phosphoribosyltransferase